MHVQSSDGAISLAILRHLIDQMVRRRQLGSNDLEAIIAALRQEAQLSPTSAADAAADRLTTWLLDIEDMG